MALPYHPQRGEVLICDFDMGGFQPPEMVKVRPAVVVSVKRSHGRGLCTVVPFSTTAANPPSEWHHPLPHVTIPGWQATGSIWAKCDMIGTVSFARLNKPYVRLRSGRAYKTVMLVAQDMRAIDAILRGYLGL
jgi:uncharacterized protein YifN (PemK superfamily)